MTWATPGAERAGGALRWIVSILDRNRVSYQVVGGLAAMAHGGTRPLNDIDLYAPLSGQSRLLADVRECTVWGPERYRDDVWDLVFMKIDFDGVRIEIGDTTSGPRYFDARHRCWTAQRVDFRRSRTMEVLGVPVNVMPLGDLLDYKRALSRPVDRQDIEELTRSRES